MDLDLSINYIVDAINPYGKMVAILVGMNVSYDLTMLDDLRRRYTELSMPIGLY